MITKDDLSILCMRFPDSVIGVKINHFNKDKTKAMLILYLQHTDVYARIEEIDPAWSCSAGAPLFVDKIIAVPMKLTVKGITRENIGEGEDYKSAYSDAIKRAAMLFGIGRYLYDSPSAWVPYDERTDKYRTWTIQDYNKSAPQPVITPHPIDVAAQYFEELPSDQEMAFEQLSEKTLPDIQTNPDEIMQFGIHKGKTFSEMLKNKGYLHWAYDEVRKKGISKTNQQLQKLIAYAKEHKVL
jgi:hypothetical protein